MAVFRRVDDLLAWAEKASIVICFLLLVAFVIIGILSRNVFHLPSQQLFESAPSLVLWMALLGASLALKTQRHIRLELFVRYLGRPLRRRIARVVNLFGAAIMGLLLFASIEFVTGEVSMFGPWGWLSVIFPIFFGIAALRYLGMGFFGEAPDSTIDVSPGTRLTP